MSEFTERAFRMARDLLTELNNESAAGVDVETVVTYMLGGGGPTTYLELWYSTHLDWVDGELPYRAVFVHHYGSDEFRYQYPSDEIGLLVERLTADPDEE